MMETQDSYGERADLEGAQGTGRKTEHWKQDRNYKTQTKCFFVTRTETWPCHNTVQKIELK